MAFQDRQLPSALEHQWGSHPDFGKGISTKNGVLTKWPSELGPFPTNGQLQGWVTAYKALSADHPSKNVGADRRKRFDIATIVAEKLTILRELL